MKNSLNFGKADHSSEVPVLFRIIADRICDITRAHGLNLAPYSQPELPYFRQLPPAKQEAALAYLKSFLDSIDSDPSGEEEKDLDKQEQALWYALSAFGLKPPSDLFKLFKPQDVVEIYDLEGFQIWRNFNFLKICSYNLEEMYSIEWFKRYAREPEWATECMGKVGDLLTGKTPEIYISNIMDHELVEIASSEMLVLNARHKWMSRLKDRSGQLAAWLVTSEVEILGSKVNGAFQKIAPLVKPQTSKF